MVQKKPMPRVDKNGNIRCPLVQQFSKFTVFNGAHEDLVRNINLPFFCIPHPDMLRTLVQKIWVGPGAHMLTSTLGG